MVIVTCRIHYFQTIQEFPDFSLCSKDFPTTRSLDSPGLTSSKISDPKGDGGAHLETDSGEALEMETPHENHGFFGRIHENLWVWDCFGGDE